MCCSPAAVMCGTFLRWNILQGLRSIQVTKLDQEKQQLSARVLQSQTGCSQLALQLKEIRERWQLTCLTNATLHKELMSLREVWQVRAAPFCSPSLHQACHEAACGEKECRQKAASALQCDNAAPLEYVARLSQASLHSAASPVSAAQRRGTQWLHGCLLTYGLSVPCRGRAARPCLQHNSRPQCPAWGLHQPQAEHRQPHLAGWAGGRASAIWHHSTWLPSWPIERP